MHSSSNSAPRSAWWNRFSPRFRRLAFTAFSLLLTIAILGVLIYQQRSTLLTIAWQFRPLPILLSFILFALNLTGMGFLWGWVLNTIGPHVSMEKHVRYYVMSNVAKRLPGTLWYVASRASMYRDEGLDLRFITLASGIEMAMIVLSASLVALGFSIPIIIRFQVSPWLVAIVLVVAALIVQPRSIRWLFGKFKVEVAEFRYTSLLLWLGGYILSWVSGGVILFVIGNILAPLPFNYLSYFIGSWTLVGLVSTALLFSPSNFGVTEIGLSVLLSTLVPSAIAVAITILARVLFILYEILLATYFLYINSRTQPD